MRAAVCAVTVSCGNGSGMDAGTLDSGADGAPDAALDASPDASTDGGLPFPECALGLYEHPWMAVDVEVERGDVSYPMEVVESSELLVRMEEGPPGEPGGFFAEIRFLRGLIPPTALPRVGDQVTVLGGDCDPGLYSAYLRIMSPEGTILFEAGDPACADHFSPLWPTPPPYVGARWREDPETCKETLDPRARCCCRVLREHDVVLHPDGDSLLVPAQDREIEIDGGRFLASAQGLIEVAGAECGGQHDGVRGSAFVARLADPE